MTESDHPNRSRSALPLLTWVSRVALLSAVAASAVLAGAHLFSMAPPGCGPASACDDAARSPFGKLPVIGLPVALPALAYFIALVPAYVQRSTLWVGSGSRSLSADTRTSPVSAGVMPVHPLVLFSLRASVCVSAFYTALMVSSSKLCVYCAVVHASVALVWVCAELARVCLPVAAVVTFRRRVGCGAAAGAVALAALVSLHIRQRGMQALATRAQLDESLRALAGPTDVAVPPPGGSSAPLPSSSGSDSDRALVTDSIAGRYPRVFNASAVGAPVEITVFSDYFCPDCRGFDARLQAFLADLPAGAPPVRVSHRHFPFCSECNPSVQRTLHPEACRAARLVEAAGLLGGPDAFWAFHQSLFGSAAMLAGAEVRSLARASGIDAERLLALAAEPESLAPVAADIRQALALGITSTPFIFVNNVELRGYSAPDALARALRAAAARASTTPTASPPLPPPTAIQRTIAEFQNAPVNPVLLDPASSPWPVIGGAPDEVVVDVFLDYQQPESTALDRLVREAAPRFPGLTYRARAFPLDQTCNPRVPRTHYPVSCRVSRVVLAARHGLTHDAYRAIHEWALANQRDYSDAALRSFDPTNAAFLLHVSGSPEAEAWLADDIECGAAAGVDAVPALFVNGRRVRRWMLPAPTSSHPGQTVSAFEAILEAAASSAPLPPSPAGVPPAPAPPGKRSDASAR